MSIAQGNGFIHISISYTNNIYTSFILQYVFADFTNDCFDLDGSCEDPIMGISV